MDNLNDKGKKLTRHEMALKSTLDGVRAYVQVRDSERKYAERTVKGARGRIGIQEVAEIKKSKNPEDMKKKRYNAAAKFYYNKEKDAWDIKILGRKESLERQLKLLKELEASDMDLGEEKANITEVRKLIENELEIRNEKAKAKAAKKAEEEKAKKEAEKNEEEPKKEETEKEETEKEEAKKEEKPKEEKTKEEPEEEKDEEEQEETREVPKMPTREDVIKIDRRKMIEEKKESIASDYLYYKDLMIKSYYGDPKTADAYDQALRRIVSHSKMRKCSIPYKDPETGEEKVAVYQTLRRYKGYEADAKFTQLEEYEARLTRRNQHEAGYPYAYPNTPEGARLYKEDKEYLDTYNQKYNSRKVTYENLKTLGNYGEKVPYGRYDEDDKTWKKALVITGNVLKFIRNHTTAPINKFIGSKIVAPLYKRNAENNGTWEYPNPFENRATHRYEKRKEYFRSQGANFITSRLKAIFNYKEGNECTLAARGKELLDDISLREYDKVEKLATQMESIAYQEVLRTHTDRLRRELSTLGEGNETLKQQYEAAIRETEGKVSTLEKTNARLDRMRPRDIIDYDAIDKGTHELRNKKNVTRVITGVKMFARAGVKFVGEKLGNWMAEHSTTVIKHDAETEFVEGHYAKEPYTDYEFSGQDKSLNYFLEGKEGETVRLYRNTYDGASSVPFEIDENTVIRGIKTEINGTDISVSDIPSTEYAEFCRYNIGPNFVEAMKQSTDLEHLGLSTQEIGQMIVDGNQGDVFLAISDTKSGIPTGWLKVSQEELTKFFGDSVKAVTKERDGAWVEGYDRIIKEAWEETVPNERMLKALNLTGKVAEGLSNAQLIDMIYENARDFDERRNAYARAKTNQKTLRKTPARSRRAYDFIEDKSFMPEGKEDQRGFNYNTRTDEYEKSVVYDDDEGR